MTREGMIRLEQTVEESSARQAREDARADVTAAAHDLAESWDSQPRRARLLRALAAESAAHARLDAALRALREPVPAEAAP